MTDIQQTAYLSLLGGLSWLVQTRMDIAVYVCYLQRNSKATTTEHYLKVNKLLRWVKRKPVVLFYGKLEGPLRLLVVSDSAFRKEDTTGLAIRGAIIALAGPANSSDNPGSAVHIMDFYSRRQRRITRSTYSAELHGLADSLELSKIIAITLTEIAFPYLEPLRLSRKEEQGETVVLIEAVVDAKSVFDI